MNLVFISTPQEAIIKNNPIIKENLKKKSDICGPKLNLWLKEEIALRIVVIVAIKRTL
jgi:hypothetical protein